MFFDLSKREVQVTEQRDKVVMVLTKQFTKKCKRNEKMKSYIRMKLELKLKTFSSELNKN